MRKKTVSLSRGGPTKVRRLETLRACLSQIIFSTYYIFLALLASRFHVSEYI